MKKLHLLILRYLSILLVGLGNLFIFYLIITPLTIYPSFFILDKIYGAVLIQGAEMDICSLLSDTELLANLACVKTTILFQGYYANIIAACIAGSAYYLLLILNLSTPMRAQTRIKSILFLFSLFLFLNICRIVFFAVFFSTYGYEAFNIAHVFFWYFSSTVLVAMLWFLNVHLFKIRGIPVYTDFKTMIKYIRGKNEHNN